MSRGYREETKRVLISGEVLPKKKKKYFNARGRETKGQR